MDIKIEKNKVPKTNPRWLKLLDNLQVGESFVADIEYRNNIATIVTQWFHRKEAKLPRYGKIFRSTAKGENGKVRFWREL